MKKKLSPPKTEGLTSRQIFLLRAQYIQEIAKEINTYIDLTRKSKVLHYTE